MRSLSSPARALAASQACHTPLIQFLILDSRSTLLNHQKASPAGWMTLHSLPIIMTMQCSVWKTHSEPLAGMSAAAKI